jgi:hypothetical protein
MGTIGEAALKEAETHPTAQHLKTQAQDRPIFKIDPHADPLFKAANNITADPQKTLQDQFTEGTGIEDGSPELITCEESGEEYQQTCSRLLKIELKIIPQKGYTAAKSCIGHWKSAWRGTKYYCGGCRGGNYVITQKKSVQVVREFWADGCKVLEDHLEKGLCRYTNIIISPKNETRIIQGEPITRDHFEEHYHYACFKTSPKTCAGLREKGCYQVKSKCKEKSGNQCILWEQTYACPSGKKSFRLYQSSNKENPFCLTGNCADTSYEANNEMMAVMGHLYALREAQNDLRKFQVIFKGEDRRCTRNCLDFRDCCGSLNGWGVTLNLSSCDEGEKQLALLRQKNLCVMVGTYCAEREKIFNNCIRKKTTFCCYGTKMARLIQQNAHSQLGIGFGSPEGPNCSGLSAEQLSRMDFSKINFSEIFEDIQNQTVTKTPKQSLAQVSTERLQNNMAVLTKPSNDSLANQKMQALQEGGF